MRFIRTGLAVLAGSLPALAQADDGGPLIIEPSSPWQVEFADTRCRAARFFGEDDERTILFLEQLAPSSSPRWVMAGSVANKLNSGGDLSVQFGPGLPEFQMDSKKKTTLGDFGRAYRGASIRKLALELEPGREGDEAETSEPNAKVGLRRLDIAEGESIDWVQFSRGDRKAIRLATGNFGQLFEILNSCMTDLVRTWGVDIEAHARMHTPAKPLNLGEIANRIQRYYPTSAERWGKQADLSVRVMVDEFGDVADCKIIEISTAERFDDRACREFARVGKFDPARDVDGAAMKSFYVTTVAYRLH